MAAVDTDRASSDSFSTSSVVVGVIAPCLPGAVELAPGRLRESPTDDARQKGHDVSQEDRSGLRPGFVTETLTAT